MDMYVKSFGKFFRVRCIARSEDEANSYMEQHDECGFLCEENGLFIVADIAEANLI